MFDSFRTEIIFSLKIDRFQQWGNLFHSFLCLGGSVLFIDSFRLSLSPSLNCCRLCVSRMPCVSSRSYNSLFDALSDSLWFFVFLCSLLLQMFFNFDFTALGVLPFWLLLALMYHFCLFVCFKNTNFHFTYLFLFVLISILLVIFPNFNFLSSCYLWVKFVLFVRCLRSVDKQLIKTSTNFH